MKKGFSFFFFTYHNRKCNFILEECLVQRIIEKENGIFFKKYVNWKIINESLEVLVYELDHSSIFFSLEGLDLMSLWICSVI